MKLLEKLVPNATAITVLIVLFCVLWVILFGFPTGILVDEQKAINALEDAGYSQIEITDRAIFFIRFRGGDRRDSVRFTAKALNPLGKEVEVYIFSGWLFKAPTIRAKPR